MVNKDKAALLKAVPLSVGEVRETLKHTSVVVGDAGTRHHSPGIPCDATHLIKALRGGSPKSGFVL